MFSSLPDLPGVFYEALLAVHSTTGLGWAGTFVLSTVLMRIGMLPLSVFSDRNSRKFNAKVTPELFKLWKDLSPVDMLGNPRKFESNAEFWKLQGVAFGAARKLWRRHKSTS
jgi:membrane protein insertase Oxa1/YidC/SpoIIIJ